MPLLQNAVFLATVARLHDLPVDSLAEVAFSGRSNAGKSSAINTLVGRARLAFVSKTPGRTQHLNYFAVAPGKYLVDLPGYGFARTPETIQKEWKKLLVPYLEGRGPLKGLLVIMDCRHPMTELDCRMLNWFAPTGRPLHILLSKADKLSRQAQNAALTEVRAALKPLGAQCSAQLFSSLKKTGVAECESVLARWLGFASPTSNGVVP
ncbi:MAG: ribosome biogenesis GTP-binding protein YihA/YsxC [Zoogloeaceae bacterium]|nr:ribosome biogenesis GTP-binding protein YihA/YsxC [Zoogloeaceae bacterium]